MHLTAWVLHVHCLIGIVEEGLPVSKESIGCDWGHAPITLHLVLIESLDDWPAATLAQLAGWLHWSVGSLGAQCPLGLLSTHITGWWTGWDTILPLDPFKSLLERLLWLQIEPVTLPRLVGD